MSLFLFVAAVADTAAVVLLHHRLLLFLYQIEYFEHFKLLILIFIMKSVCPFYHRTAQITGIK